MTYSKCFLQRESLTESLIISDEWAGKGQRKWLSCSKCFLYKPEDLHPQHPHFLKRLGVRHVLQPQCLVEMGCAETDRCPGLACQWAPGLVRDLVPPKIRYHFMTLCLILLGSLWGGREMVSLCSPRCSQRPNECRFTSAEVGTATPTFGS